MANYKFPKFTILRLFMFIIVGPTAMVMITITTMQNDPREYKVTHEVYFEVESDGKALGKITFGLFGETVPRTVKNFITFSTKGFNGHKYEGTKFHRVIKKFMIQGGDVISGDGKGTISIYGPSFPDENFEIKHARPGFLSMANRGKDTNGCQFFITTIATPWLDGSHVVFGKVIDGLSVVHVIEHLATDWDDKPLKEVIITKTGRKTVKTPYYVSDDPYNLYDWLKTISIPLGLSFCIIYIFNYFIGKLENHIIDDDGSVCLDEDEDDDSQKMKTKKAALEEEQKVTDDKAIGGKENNDAEVRKRTAKADAKKEE